MAERFTTPFHREFDTNGLSLDGAKLFFFDSATGDQKDTFSDNALTLANTNPVIADGNGRFSDIFLETGAYKVILQDKNGVQIFEADPYAASSDTLRADLADTTDNAKGDALIRVLRTDTGAEATTQHQINELSPVIMGADYGASLSLTNGTDDWTTVIISAIATGRKIIFPDGGIFRVTATITFATNDLDVEFQGNAYIKPDAAVLKPVIIGSSSTPARMTIKGLRVDRTTYSGATENYGIVFLECAQCTFTDFESRFSKYNIAWEPTTGGFAYNTLINPQGIGGFYNFWLDASSTGYVNENAFLGGRGFCTANTDTNLRIDAGGLGTGSNAFYTVSLEGQGVQSIYDDGNNNRFFECRTEGTWTGTASHVYGTNCPYATLVSSRNDYTLDRSGATDPRDNVVTYRSGSFHNTANNEVTTLEMLNQSASRGTVLEMQQTRDNDDAYVWRALRKIAQYSGTHDGANNAATLSDSGASFSVTTMTDGIVYNTTDGSYGIITGGTTTTATATLYGGTDNDWDTGDAYIIYLFNGFLKSTGAMQVRRSLEIKQSAYSFFPFQMGNFYFWFNGNDFRVSIGEPTSATDGTLIATAT